MQSLYLTPVQAAKLDELAETMGKTKAEMLRIAVDNLLGMYGMGDTLTTRIIRDALKQSSECVRRLRSTPRLEKAWQQKCEETEVAIRDALVEVSAPQIS